MVPSITSLWRHWLRTCYICSLWSNSHLSNVHASLPRPEDSGWLFQDGKYSIDWEDPAKIEKVRNNIDFLLRGCGCKTGCSTNRCRCHQKSMHCGPGCTCTAGL